MHGMIVKFMRMYKQTDSKEEEGEQKWRDQYHCYNVASVLNREFISHIR